MLVYRKHGIGRIIFLRSLIRQPASGKCEDRSAAAGPCLGGSKFESSRYFKDTSFSESHRLEQCKTPRGSNHPAPKEGQSRVKQMTENEDSGNNSKMCYKTESNLYYIIHTYDNFFVFAIPIKRVHRLSYSQTSRNFKKSKRPISIFPPFHLGTRLATTNRTPTFTSHIRRTRSSH